MEEFKGLWPIVAGMASGVAGAAIWMTRTEAKIEALQMSVDRIENLVNLITVVHVKERE